LPPPVRDAAHPGQAGVGSLRACRWRLRTPVGRLTDLVSLGALTSLVPRDVLDEAIEAHGCREERVR